jgi:hypothetical protein
MNSKTYYVIINTCVKKQPDKDEDSKTYYANVQTGVAF